MSFGLGDAVKVVSGGAAAIIDPTSLAATGALGIGAAAAGGGGDSSASGGGGTYTPPPDSAYSDIAGKKAPKYWRPEFKAPPPPKKAKTDWGGIIGSVIGTAAGAYFGGGNPAAIAVGSQVGSQLGSAIGGGNRESQYGGSAAASSISTIVNSPEGGKAISAVIAENNKEADTKDTETAKNNFKKVGLYSTDKKLSLPDGSVSDFSTPGNPTLNTQHSLDYTAGISGIALSNLINGKSTPAVTSAGVELGNRSLGVVGTSQDLTLENFNKVAKNMQAVYAQAGIKSKSDAYQLSNQAYAENRLNESQLATMHKTFDMVFDENGYDIANQISQGRNHGKQSQDYIAPVALKTKPKRSNLSRSQIIARNKQTSGVAA